MTAPDFTIESFSNVVSSMPEWLWELYLPRSRVAILDGDPGIGKSLVALDLAARLSRGGPLPDGKSVARPHVTLYLSAEDRPGDTLRPRAEAAGADVSRIYHIRSDDHSLLRFPADLAALEKPIAEIRADLVVIDPVMAFLPPAVATSNDQCVRSVMCAFDAVAARTGCTILLIRHLRKKEAAKAVYRGLGSVGIIGGTRIGLLAALQPGGDGRRVLAVTKTNLREFPPPLGFRPRGDEQGRAMVEWTGPVEIAADVLAQSTPAARARDCAALWLHEQLASGPRPSTEILAAAAKAGIPEGTLKRAKSEVGVRSHQVVLKDDRRIWYWYDLRAPWPKDAPFKKPRELDPLDW
jgi:AAA domain-containing protein